MHQPGHKLEQCADIGQIQLRFLGQPLLLLLSLLLWRLCLAEALCSAGRGDHLQSRGAEVLFVCCDAAAMGEAVTFNGVGIGCRG